ncbi:sensor histidine kinase [Streptomyces sp. NBC_01264]|uniref:sensor histidine kinase n=1 Tax=Streptomyces sp. NBC_01264 TaxID=2903804 RepID=UPI002258F559|nr:ATP-binding protein [Streptomyces sp. NBC_01264]MCX4781741.1 histidine kinase [Streptomyces sp. NBC_01264]
MGRDGQSIRFVKPAFRRSVGQPWASVSSAMRDHAWLALRINSLVRVFITTALFIMNITVFPPRDHPLLCYTIMWSYAAVNVLPLVVRWDRVTPFAASLVPVILDLVVITTVLTLSGGFPKDTSNYITLFDDLYFLVPILAAFQLYPSVTAFAGVASVAVYISAAVAAAPAPDWVYLITHAVFIAMSSLCCVVFSSLQRSRVTTIAALVQQRSVLLGRVISLEEDERRKISEVLHDGALQSVLAAKLDAEEISQAEPGEDIAGHVTRLESALADAARQLRYSVTELHPDQVELAGLERALRAMFEEGAARGGFEVDLSCEVAGPTPIDELIFRAAGEFLSNTVKHAKAKHVTVRLELTALRARLEVTDDGVGIASGVLASRAAEGHIGVSSQRVRVEGMGGSFSLENVAPHGTRAVIELPVPAS